MKNPKRLIVQYETNTFGIFKSMNFSLKQGLRRSSGIERGSAPQTGVMLPLECSV